MPIGQRRSVRIREAGRLHRMPAEEGKEQQTGQSDCCIERPQPHRPGRLANLKQPRAGDHGRGLGFRPQSQKSALKQARPAVAGGTKERGGGSWRQRMRERKRHRGLSVMAVDAAIDGKMQLRVQKAVVDGFEIGTRRIGKGARSGGGMTEKARTIVQRPDLGGRVGRAKAAKTVRIMATLAAKTAQPTMCRSRDFIADAGIESRFRLPLPGMAVKAAVGVATVRRMGKEIETADMAFPTGQFGMCGARQGSRIHGDIPHPSGLGVEDQPRPTGMAALAAHRSRCGGSGGGACPMQDEKAEN